MLKVSYYAEKLNLFFSSYYQSDELHYIISVQIDFSIDVYLYMEDSSSFNREQLKANYKEWFLKSSPLIEGEDSTIHEQRCLKQVNEDFAVYFNNGAVRFYVNDFDEPGDSKECGIRWSSTYRLTSLLNKFKETPKIDLPIVTFYSYKGGMGRTTTMMGFALWLAAKNKRVAIIDCDLEAPGYLNFFNLSNHIEFVRGTKNGFVEFMADYCFMNNNVNISDYTVTPKSPQSRLEVGSIYDKIFIVPGGNLNEGFISEKSDSESEDEFDSNYSDTAKKNRKDYINGLARLNLSNPIALKRTFSALIQKLKEEYHIDIVLIDSRTGFNDIYGSTAFDLASIVVAFFGFSKQTMPGLRQLLERYIDENKKLHETGSKPLSLTMCNSILPEKAILDSDDSMREIWSGVEKNFARQVELICENRANNGNKETIYTYSIHRRKELEELGLNEDADFRFLDMVVNDSFEDYSNLFSSIYNDILGYYPQIAHQVSEDSSSASEAASSNEIGSMQAYLDSIKGMRSLQLTKVILRELKAKLEPVKNFAEQMEGLPKKEVFLYRDCMKEIFNPTKFIIRGYKGSGKTCIYQALGQSNEVTDFIKKRAGKESVICAFVNVIDFDGISNHPLKLLEEDGAFDKDVFFNINAFWQILMWKAIFSNTEYSHILAQSLIEDRFKALDGIKGHKLLNAIVDMIASGASKVLAAIDDDLERLDSYLQDNGSELFIMYDGLDNVVKPKYWSKAISPLINKWGGNLSAYKNIHPKIFLRTDLFERIEGTNVERLKGNIVDIDWEISEVFGYLFKLVLGSDDNPSREAMWAILRKLRADSAEATIQNMTRSIKNGLGQFPTLDKPNLKILVEIFFGRKVAPKGAQLGDPWSYFEKQLSNAAGKISMRLFINTLTTDVIDRALENSNTHVTEVISPDLYASREVRIKVAESYFNDMASEEDFTDDLKKVRDFINSEDGKDYRKKVLSETEFNGLTVKIIEIYRKELRAVETASELAQLMYASGLIKEIYKRGRKVYRFAPMYEYAWGLVGKSVDDDEERMEGVLKRNPKGKFTILTDENHFYECEETPKGISIGTRVRFKPVKRKMIGGGFYNMSTDIEAID